MESKKVDIQWFIDELNQARVKRDKAIAEYDTLERVIIKITGSDDATEKEEKATPQID